MSLGIFALTLAIGSYLVGSSIGPNSRFTLVTRLSKPTNQPSLLAIEINSLKFRLKNSFSSKARLRTALSELPEILEMLVVALSAGDGLFAALARVSPRATGTLPSELRRLFIALELGADLETELDALARRLPQRQVVEFAAKLSVALRRGSPLAHMLREQAESARADIRNDLLREVGRNETRMLIPLVFLILPVTVLFAVYPSIQLISSDYF